MPLEDMGPYTAEELVQLHLLDMGDHAPRMLFTYFWDSMWDEMGDGIMKLHTGIFKQAIKNFAKSAIADSPVKNPSFYHILYELPLSEMPRFINEPFVGYLAKWRLSIGK